MDLYFLEKKVFFIPTPGQPEQEYLAEYHLKTHGINYQKQGVINLDLVKFNFINPKSRIKKKLLEAAFNKVNL